MFNVPRNPHAVNPADDISAALQASRCQAIRHRSNGCLAADGPLL